MGTMKIYLVTILFSLGTWNFISGQANGQNLLVNGDFSSGNSGFYSTLIYTSDLIPENTYAIGTDPADFHDNTYSYGDHTTGTGLMMIVNGPTTANQVIWQETVTVTADTSYQLSAWAARWYLYDTSPAQLQFSINETAIGSLLTLTENSDAWNNFTGSWYSGNATSATIEISDFNLAANGNDFSLDDLSFQSVPEPEAGFFLLSVLFLFKTRRVLGKALGA